MKLSCLLICLVTFLIFSSCGWNEPVDNTPIDLTAPYALDSLEPHPPPPPPAP